MRRVPYLKDLIQDVEPIAEKMNTATNYSMINGQFADLDQRWLLVGDAAYFVDPLFSSGVAFATNQAANAAMLLETTLAGDLDERSVRDLWRDYDEGWQGMAETFALSIDQWYHALGKDHMDSIYWRHRGDGPDLDIQEQTFDVLLNTAVTPNLMQVITGSVPKGVGPLSRATERAEPAPVDEHAPLGLAARVIARETVGLDAPGFKAFMPAPPFDAEVDDETRAAIARYWSDPIKNGDVVVSPVAAPAPALRFGFADQPDAAEVRGLAREGAAELLDILRFRSASLRQLETKLTTTQLQLLKRLMRAGMVTVDDPAADA